MQNKEVTEKLGINRERIKYFKKQAVFVPEKPFADSSKNIVYTERDFTALKKLVVLTKCGLTCGDIKKVQDGESTLHQAFNERKRIVEEEMKRMRGSLLLAEELLKEDIQYETMPVGCFWSMIQEKEREGEVFMDLYDYYPVSSLRIVKCPHCTANQEIDFEDYLWDETFNESHSDNDMGSDIIYSFDTEDNYLCRKCGNGFRVEGWIREYPVGAYDSENIEILVMEELS
ncbi:MerR family transcriptional regulator [Jeotgalibaca caeni]|uniref:MerR family transcriptional regulator n=1 Tax=Jeotgalibaca caeni TaxID=3028623 RepID=UPI00237E5335|nr:MerR family transcriptional regulator [Jeotgalibaca caeni]MDE1549835.1 MerR family transcriptional regulator [Jeotgalibaca caeni]